MDTAQQQPTINFGAQVLHFATPHAQLAILLDLKRSPPQKMDIAHFKLRITE